MEGQVKIFSSQNTNEVSQEKVFQKIEVNGIVVKTTLTETKI